MNQISAAKANVFLFRAFSAFIYVILLLVVVLAPLINYSSKRAWVAHNLVFLLFAAVIGVVVVLLVEKLNSHSSSKRQATSLEFSAIVIFGTLILFVLQMFIIGGGYFKSGWDVAAITDYGNAGAYTEYYSRYPNQLFLAGLFSKISKLGLLFGLTDGYRCLVVCGCICVSICAPMVAYIGRKLGGYAVGYCTLLLFVVFIGCCPWILIPYSDVYAMPFTCAAIFAYVCIPKKQVKWFAVVFASLIGFFIKPTAIFALCAIIVVEIFTFARRRGKADSGLVEACDESLSTKQKAYHVVTCLISMIAALTLAIACFQIVKLKVHIDEERSFGAAHFLMMGFNPERAGVWSGDDVKFSASFTNKEERNAGDMKRWADRVSEMGPGGVGKIFLKKTLTNYADGTFAWEHEGRFYVDTIGVSEYVKSIYGIDDVKNDVVIKEREPLFAPFAQTLWFLVLLGIALGLLKAEPTKQECAMSLALLMLSVFLLLFECRARYLFLYAPYFVMLGILGWQSLHSFILKRVSKQKLGLDDLQFDDN